MKTYKAITADMNLLKKWFEFRFIFMN